MNKIGLIIKREYLNRVSKKSFLLVTFLTPFLFAALVFVPLWLSTIKGDDVRQVAVVDTTGKYASLFKDTQNYHFIQSQQTLEEYRNAKNKDVYAILNITGDLLQQPDKAALYSEKQIAPELVSLINNTLTQYLEDEKLESFNIPNIKEIIAESKIRFDVTTIKWGEDGTESTSSAHIASMIGMILTFIVFFFIMTYGGIVMQGVMEEKTNRIVELMVSSVRPFELMMGKVVGIGLVGLTQIFLWAIMTGALIAGSQMLLFHDSIDPAALSTVAMNGSAMPGTMMPDSPVGKILQAIQTINFTEIGICFIFYFIGGYMLYAALFAAIGSAVESQEDTQQFMTPIMLILLFAFYAGIYSMQNPDGPLAFWGSFIPFSSPIVMMIRLPFDVPLWQVMLSVVLLFITATAIIWFSAKIYRVGILMYGKKPSFKELIKWVRFK